MCILTSKIIFIEILLHTSRSILFFYVIFLFRPSRSARPWLRSSARRCPGRTVSGSSLSSQQTEQPFPLYPLLCVLLSNHTTLWNFRFYSIFFIVIDFIFGINSQRFIWNFCEESYGSLRMLMYVYAVESCHLGFIVALSVTSSRSVSCPDSLCWLLALPFFLNLPSPLDAPSTLSSPPDPRFHYRSFVFPTKSPKTLCRMVYM